MQHLGLRALREVELEPEQMPNWARVLHPFVHAEREELAKLADNVPEIAQWAWRLRFQSTSVYRVVQ